MLSGNNGVITLWAPRSCFQCTLCSKKTKYTSYQIIKRHFKDCHTSAITYNIGCSFCCMKQFENYPEWKQHLDSCPSAIKSLYDISPNPSPVIVSTIYEKQKPAPSSQTLNTSSLYNSCIVVSTLYQKKRTPTIQTKPCNRYESFSPIIQTPKVKKIKQTFQKPLVSPVATLNPVPSSSP
ncbi:hypothetical protein RF11_08609 [Thelohanellus kitauei]|uniref:Uncharacterized protein n=1 Tax=Thelohanellus kitauei TaxID=669202 RepID=A0A0C2MK85_THEKT|nr:hypothetical protein RF11_08609 [Thelohanellus kitauei]